MATVTNYTTLVQAITDWTHRADLAAYADYFIQNAQENIQNDIPDLNFGNYIRMMEAAYGPADIYGGVTPVPPDWLGAKIMTIADGSGDIWPLLMKAASWLYGNYPARVACGLPAYIARDVMAPASFTASLSGIITLDADFTLDGGITVDAGGAGGLQVSAVASGTIQVGMILAGAGIPTSVTDAVTVLQQESGVPGGPGDYLVSNPITVASEAMTGGGDTFIFGPYADSQYQVSGTYYQAIPALTSASQVNWLSTKYPSLLTAACLVEAAKFTNDAQLMSTWSPIYQQKLKSMVDADKAERWAAGTLDIEVL